ncbi:MAG: MATE family efflux transporter [Bulleidia sp.]|nr:MATE family efflux transporter [Bulleidia sp.]
MKQTHTKDMTSGPIAKQILMFAIPLMLGNVFQMLYNTVDSVVVGKFVGTQALAAIGNTTLITNMAVFFFNGFAIGAGVVVGRLFGARETDRLHTAVETIITVTFILAAAFTVIGYYGQDFLLHVMNTPADVFPQASTYLKIYFLGVSGLLVYNIGAGILQAVGDSTRPLYFLILTSLLNIVLDLVFVLVFHMGIGGAAWATIISQFISAILVMFLLVHTDDIYQFVWHDMCIDKELLGQILAIGLPAAIQSSITAFSNIFVQSYVNYFGSVVMAGWAAYNKLNQFVMLPMQTMAMAATTFVSQNMGAQNYKRANQGTRTSLIFTEGITFTIVTTVVLLSRQAAGLFTNDSQVVDIASIFIRQNMYFLLFNCINHVLAGALRGRGDSRGPMIIMLISFVAIRQVYLFIMSRFISNTPQTISFGYPVGWLCCAVIELTYYFLKWNRKEKTG